MDSFTMSGDGVIFKSTQRSVCAYAIAFKLLSYLFTFRESVRKEKKGEKCKQPQLQDNHMEQLDKATKALWTQKWLLQFHKV